MSFSLASKVMNEISVDHAEREVLIAMAEHADDEGKHCYPSVDRISWKTEYSRRTVQRVMASLRDRGVLRVVREASNKRPCEYELHLSKAQPKIPFEEWKKLKGTNDETEPWGVTVTPQNESRGVILSPLNTGLGVTSVQLGVTSTTSGGDTGDTRMVIETVNRNNYMSGPSDTDAVSVPVKGDGAPAQEPEDALTPKRKYRFEPDDLRFADFMAKRIQHVLPSFRIPRKLDAWANEIRLMREVDKRSHRDIQTLFVFANKHHFWWRNIQSPDKLRKQWSRLEAEMLESLGHGPVRGALALPVSRGSDLSYLDRIKSEAVPADQVRQLLSSEEEAA